MRHFMDPFGWTTKSRQAQVGICDITQLYGSVRANPMDDQVPKYGTYIKVPSQVADQDRGTAAVLTVCWTLKFPSTMTHLLGGFPGII